MKRRDRAKPKRRSKRPARAEKAVAAQVDALLEMPPDDLKGALHDLLAHQDDLEAENKRLRADRDEVAQCCDRYFEVFDWAPDGIVLCDADLNVVDLNTAAMRDFRREAKEELIGENFGDVLPAAGQARRLEEYRAIRETGEPLSLEDVVPEGVLGDSHFSITAFRVGEGIGFAARDTTAEKEAEAALRASEEKYRLVSENIPCVVYSALPGVPPANLLVSGQRAELTGYTTEEFLEDAELLPRIIHPDDRARVAEATAHHQEAKTELDIEYRITTKTGESRWVRDKATPVLDERGELTRIDGFVEDVTERKQAEEALSASESNLRSLFDTVEDFLFIVDSEGCILLTNPVVRERLGYSAEELAGMPIPHIHPPAQRDEAAAIIADMLAGGASLCPVPLTARDGTLIPVETKVTRGKWGGQDVLFGVSRDVAARREAEQALRESEEKYRLISENIPCAVYSTLPDEHSTNLFLSGRLVELTGYTAEELLADPELWPALLHTDDRARVWEAVADHRKNKAVLDVEYRIAAKDGGLKWIRDKARPVLDEEGEIARIDGFMEDVTERKAAEARQHYLASLLADVSDAVISTDMAFNVLSWNAAAERTYGWNEAEVLGKPLAEILPTRYADGANQEAVLAAFVAAGSWNGEVTQPRRNGEAAHISASVSLVRNAQGEPVGAVAVNRDVTKEKAAAAALRESEERFRLLAQNIPHVFWMSKPGIGEMVYVSPAYEQVWGRTRESLYESPRSFMEAVHPDDRERVLAEAERHAQAQVGG